MNWMGKRVLVAGMARSGLAAAEVLLGLGALPVLYDGKPLDKLPAREAAQKLLDAGCESALGMPVEQALSGCELEVVSPGVPVDAPIQTLAPCPVWGEVELGYRLCAAEVAAITGTNGKTTTTALLEHMLRQGGFNGKAAGNIGTPFVQVAAGADAADKIALEVSSFQLETVHAFHPKAAALLNITEDHLNRHGTMEVYAHTKARVFANQTKEDAAILNGDDPLVMAMAGDIPSTIYTFSRKAEPQRGIWQRGDDLLLKLNGENRRLCSVGDIRIPGGHNVENAMAAILLAVAMGVSEAAIVESLRTFPGVEHRIERVAEIGGVVYYNDSKGTNVDSTIKAVEAMTRPTVLMAGGYDKHADFKPMIRAFGDRIKCLVVMGDTREQIAEAAKNCGYENVVRADSFAHAFELAAGCAASGDNVLLSPACASFDMFKDYEERGRVFKEMVLQHQQAYK